MIALTIQPEKPADFAAVKKIITLAFADMPFSDHREAELVDALRSCAGYIPELALIAKTNEQIIGQVLLTQIHLQTQEGLIPVLSLSPLSVHPSFQRQGVGSTLMNEALVRAAKLGHRAILLVGAPEFYQRFGFASASLFGIRFPFDIDGKFCLAKELYPHSLHGLRAKAIYSPPFFA